MAYRAEVGKVIQAVRLQIVHEVENVFPLPKKAFIREGDRAERGSRADRERRDRSAQGLAATKRAP